MTDYGKYICAFRGRRDYYQIPIALNEGAALEEFVTDAYFGATIQSMSCIMPRGIREKIRSRFDDKLPEARVQSLWLKTVMEHVRHRLGVNRALTYAKFDRLFSLAAAERARATRGNLFLYNPYAWEAFTAHYGHCPHKVLFQFHPHPDLERRILLNDCQAYPVARQSFNDETSENLGGHLIQRNRDSWKHADLILSASSFTQLSLLEAGADPNLCKVVPYGIDVNVTKHIQSSCERFIVLFVGTGSQRKGLHHLLLAWGMAHLPRNSQLLLVCRTIDPAIRALAQRTPNVRLLNGVGLCQLEELFRSSSLFAMPSLIEGFGQVYLEALSQGCPVLGTRNTGLPDLGGEADPIWMVKAGEIDQLVSELERLSRLLPGNVLIRERAVQCALRWPWEQFRRGTRSALALTDPGSDQQ